MENELLIPAALQFCVDDVGWWCGRDDRAIGGPSRPGFVRNHCAEDYRALEELGKAIRQKLYCAFVLGEWDLEDRLGKEVPNFSHYGDAWNNSAYRDPAEMKKAVEIVNRSEYIEVAVHGLYHGYYSSDNPSHDTSDYYIRYAKDRMDMIPEEEVRMRLDHFFRLYREHGFTKPIRGFVPPSGAYRGFELSKILRDYGILYNVSSFFRPRRFAKAEDPDLLRDVFVEDDFITVQDQGDPIDWDAHDADLRPIDPFYGVMGVHWPNLLHEDPAKHGETLKKWVPYVQKCAEIFGIVISRDIGFCATQELCRKYSKIAEDDDSVAIDLRDVPQAIGRSESFCVSVRKPIKMFENCIVLETQQHDGFVNYELKPNGDRILVHF
ncbi:MAG: hypothetical protein IJC46_00095 [Clostridia bacterium]|nr:hypothetical protein [Clostridia bacterium]